MIAGAATRRGADALELALLEGVIHEMADGIALVDDNNDASGAPLPKHLASGGAAGEAAEAMAVMSESLRDRRQRRRDLDARLATINASIQAIMRDLRALSEPRAQALTEEFF